MAGRNAGHFWRFYGTVVPENKEECEEVVNCLSKRFCIQNKEQWFLKIGYSTCFMSFEDLLLLKVF